MQGYYIVEFILEVRIREIIRNGQTACTFFQRGLSWWVIMTNKKISLGFVGIGLMGKPMSLRLLDAGFSVNVWNRSPEKLKPVTDAGARACCSVAELVQASEVIILCLADTVAVESIVRDGIVTNGATGKLLIDLSSIHPENTRQLAALLHEQCAMGWVDAPVSGGVAGAEQAGLFIFVGATGTRFYPEHREKPGRYQTGVVAGIERRIDCAVGRTSRASGAGAGAGR